MQAVCRQKAMQAIVDLNIFRFKQTMLKVNYKCMLVLSVCTVKNIMKHKRHSTLGMPKCAVFHEGEVHGNL